MQASNLNAIEQNPSLLKTISIMAGARFEGPFLVLLLQGRLGSSLLTGTVLALSSITTVVLEIPSGVLADRYGRVPTLSLGYMFQLLQMTLLFLACFGDAGTFSTQLLCFGYAVCRGTADALISGTDAALLFDTLKHVGREDSYANEAASTNMWEVSAAVSAAVGGIMVHCSGSLVLPLFCSCCMTLLATLSSFRLTEAPHGNEKGTQASVGVHMRETIADIIGSRTLLLLFMYQLVTYATGEVAFQFRSLWYLEEGVPTEYHALAAIATFSMSAIGTRIAAYVDTGGPKALRLLLLCSLFTLITNLMAVTIFAGPLSVGFAILPSLAWGMSWPAMSSLVNECAEPARRATLLSVASSFRELGFALAAPSLGVHGDAYGQRSMQFATACIYVLAPTILLLVPRRREKLKPQ
eukprot:m.22301 g.22301  ORF g.22301 m.22301 type:complete len:411 (-) comp13765_c0_seq1:338-1570(-)